MLTDGLVLAEGSAITNATVAKGTSFPSLPDEGELFFRTDLDALHVYNGTQWIQVGLTSALLDGQTGAYYLDNANATGTLAVSKGGTGVTSYGALVTALGLDIGTNVQAFDADLSAIAALAGTSGFLKKTAANTWSLDTTTYLTGNQPITLSGDVSGSGNTNITVTLATVGTAGTYKSVTVNAKGLVTAGTNPTTLAGYGITDAQALDADLTAIAALAGTSGILTKTAANTWALDTASYLPLTGGTITGNITMTGSIIPSANITYDLGSPTMMWKDIYVGPGSIYMNGQKILENVSQTIIFSADDNQNIRVETGGTGNLELLTGASASILVKSTMTVTSGKRILDSSGIQVEFGDNIEMNANRITGLAAPTGVNDAANKAYVDGLTGNDGTIVRTTGDQTIAGNKTFSGNVTINGVFTSNSTSVLFADNILEFNADFTTGTPTEDAGFQVRRGDLGVVKFAWDETNDRFALVDGVSNGLALYTGSTVTAVGGFIGNATTATALATGRTFSLSGDATGTSAAFTGAANASIPMTLATVNSNVGTFGTAAQVGTFTVNAKGLVTAASNVSIEIPTSAVTSGTFADARIAASNVTQHQAALTILESQITDGTIFPRLAGTEVVTGTWSFNNPINIGTPTISTHAATKQYVDDLINGVSWKSTAKVATTANITLSGTQTIDGVAVVAGNRVLVKNQTTTSQNGVYVVAAGAWTRAADFDATPSVGEVNGAAIFIETGTTNGDTSWVQTATVATIGTDPLVFAQFSGGAAVTAGANLTLTGNVIALNTTLTGLSSVTSTNFVGTLTGAAPAGSLSGTTLASGVTASSLTSVGTLSSLAVGGTSTYAGQATFSGANVPIMLNGAAGTARRMQINTAGSARWQLGANGVAESGSNLGTDFIVVRYDDTGAVIDQPLVIWRNSGLVQVGSLSATNITGTNITGTLTGSASNNVLKAGDTMTGTLVTNIGGGATSSTKHLQMINGSGYDLFMAPRVGAGSYGGLAQIGDALIGYSAGAIDTGALVIGPWSASAKGIRIDVTGMVGIGTAGNLNAGTGLTGGLNVSGIITAGSATSTNGSLILAGYYGSLGATTTFGSEFSSGGPSIGYGVRPSASAAGAFTSTVGTSSLTRGALTIAGDTMKFFTGSAQVVAVGSAVTMAERMSVDQNTMQFNGANLRVNGGSNLLIQHDSTHAYIRPLNAGANLFLGAQAVNTMTISSSAVGVAGTLGVSGNVNAPQFNTYSAGLGYVTMRQSGASNTGYFEFLAANGNRQGYIGNSATTATTDAGNIPYVAATHSFSGTIVGTLSGNSSGTHTGAVVGNASTATALQTARTIGLTGGAFSTTAASFDGTSNITITVDHLNATNLTAGTVPSARLSGTYAISISGNAATATTATTATSATSANVAGYASMIAQYDGTSRLSPVHAAVTAGARGTDLAPNLYSSGLFSEFKNSSLYGFTGSYVGLLTYAPWVGTTASTGDPSYQLAFHATAANATSNPQLKFRAGIDTTWGAWTTVLTSLNYNSFVPQLNGTGASGTWGINITGTAPFANLVNRPVVADWPTNGATFVSGLMGWKNYGNGHVIFDASAGTAPNGTAKSNSVPDNAWSSSYPTLMGWNGANTYGVKVNRADLADNASALGGYAPSVSTAGNTVVVRDGSGYIYNSYFNSSDNSQASSVTAVMVKAGDNFLRSGTAGAIATFLSGQTMNIAGSATSLTALNANNANGVNPDNITNGYIGYASSGISLFGQTDGALYSQYFSASWMHQIFGDYRTGQLAVRGRNNGTLSGWRTVLDSGNYTSYAPSLTGSGASGTWGINISGNAATAGSATSTSQVIGAGAAIYGTFGTSYGNAVQIREAGAGGAQASAAGAAPRLGFHWGGVVASSIALSTSGRIEIHNNPGTGYESLAANNIQSYGQFIGSGAGLTGTASGLSIGGSASYATTAASTVAFMSTSHNGTYWLTNNWDGTYWYITSNHGSPVRVGRADTAGSASTASSAGSLTGNAYTNGSDGWFRSVGQAGWYSADYSVGIYATEAGNVRTYNSANFIASNITANGTVYASGEITAFSDARIKTDVVVIPNALEKVEQIRGVTFTRTDERHAGERQTGVIAQELEAVLPEAVRETDEGMKTVNYGSTVGLLIEAIKELSAQNKALMARLEALEAKE